MTLKTTKLRDAIKFAIAVGTIAGTGTAFAQDAAAPQEKEATTLERIEVTGSRIKRTDIETSQPVFSLSRADIEAQGLTSVGDVIQNISTNGSTLNTTMNNGGNGETRVNLRNLGSARTLVLVNGRRWVGGTGLGGAVDLNTIPTAAVERIEVLKDGASVIYGSDAIAGVVNVILRQNFDGAEANAYIGQFDKGDGTRQAYDVTIGSSGDRWSAMLGAGYVKEDPVWAGDREISAVPNFGSTPGFGGSAAIPEGLFCIFDADLGCTSPAHDEYGVFIPDASGPNGYRIYSGTPDNYNFAPDNYLITPQERVSVFANASLDITDNVRFRITSTFNQRRSQQILAAMPVSFGLFGSGNGSTVVISEDNIYNQFGEQIDGGLRRTVESGGRIFSQDVDTFAFNGSFEGSFDVGSKFFDWEAGYFFGENEQNDTTDGLLTYTALRNALGASFIDEGGVARCGTPGAIIDGCVPLDFTHGPGSITPEMLNYISFQAHDAFGYKQKTYYANVGGGLFALPGGDLAFSFGVEHRTESGYDHPDALINAGDTTGNARTATEGGYSVDEAYLELAIPLLADVPFAKLLDFSVATRYSDYSNFGDTLNSKFGFRWKPIEDLMIRGNWTEGFRAPSITELFSGAADSFPTITDPCAGSYAGIPNTDRPASCAGVPAYNQQNPQVRITVGGNIDLLPETSTSKTFGFVYSPGWLEGFDISLDWYNVTIDDTITFLGGQEILDRCYREADPGACALIERGPTGAISDLLSAGLNIGSTEVEGYDMTIGYRLPETAWGKFSIIWDSTYLSSYINDDDGDNLAGEYQDRNNNWRIRSNVNVNWEKGDFGVNWYARYYSGQDESCSGVASSQRPLLCSDPDRFIDGPDGTPVQAPENYIPAVVYNDVSAYWNAPWNAKITLGVNNVLDRDPPRSATTFANSFDPQYEIPGRFYYMKYTQKF
jgi:iron complex outermembrane recepter protein